MMVRYANAKELFRVTTMGTLMINIEKWAQERGLNSADPSKQMLKLMEEVGEIAGAMARGNTEEVMDGIGDVYVVLTILAMQMGIEIDQCVEIAYEEISERKGEMINGVFVKEEDIK